MSKTQRQTDRRIADEKKEEEEEEEKTAYLTKGSEVILINVLGLQHNTTGRFHF